MAIISDYMTANEDRLSITRPKNIVHLPKDCIGCRPQTKRVLKRISMLFSVLCFYCFKHETREWRIFTGIIGPWSLIERGQTHLPNWSRLCVRYIRISNVRQRDNHHILTRYKSTIPRRSLEWFVCSLGWFVREKETSIVYGVITRDTRRDFNWTKRKRSVRSSIVAKDHEHRTVDNMMFIQAHESVG